MCKTPDGPPAQPWFVEATAELGLAASAELEPLGNTIVSADLDGDDFADLIAVRLESDRGLIAGKRARFLLMNRPLAEGSTERTFVDVPDLGGLLQSRDGTADRGMSTVFVGDLDNDEDIDVVACPADIGKEELTDPCSAFLNNGDATFTLAPESDIDASGKPAHSAALFDYDRDGILDFAVGGIGNTFGDPWNFGPKLYKGVGDGTFQDVSADAGLPTLDGSLAAGTKYRRSLGVAHCDLDGDGDQDFIATSYGRQGNQVWRNDDGVFVEVAHELGLDHDDREDYWEDESFRCYCAAMESCDPMPPPPQVNCNAFGGPYLRGWGPSSTQSYMLGGNNMGVTCSDVDDDSDMDVVFATIVHGDVGPASDPTELILNPGDGGKFTRPGNDVTGLVRPDMTGIDWNHGDHMATFADVDLDGRKDLYVADVAYPDRRPWLWQQRADGTFLELADAAGLDPGGLAQLGATFVDVDHDGDLDLFTADYEYGDESRALHAFQNQVGAQQNFVRIKLVGKGAGFSNGAGIGARVRVTSGGRTQVQEIKGGQGLLNIQSDLVLTFGLGSACDIDEVEVRWPDARATITSYKNPRANYLLVLHEGEAQPEYR